MTTLFVAAVIAYGTHLLYTAYAFAWRGFMPAPTMQTPQIKKQTVRAWMIEAGLDGVEPIEFLLACSSSGIAGGIFGFAMFGTFIPTMLCAICLLLAPVAVFRSRRRNRLSLAQEAWPRLIDELRLQTGTLGRSIPTALFELTSSVPEVMRNGFESAHREWMLTTDFEKTLYVLRQQVADATCDATCETLLLAQLVGGSALDQRLQDLAEDRRTDLSYRKDISARLSGVRFARRFVLLVPLGMAGMGMMMGNGRAAYTTSTGQIAVTIALGMVAACWKWAGELMRLPTESRVFTS